jgi:uncharacterized protein with HEPN domain
MSKREPTLLVCDMIESAESILSFTAGMTYEQFLEDKKTRDAVVRNFEIIGEAANRLPDDFKALYPNIDWQRLRGLRNRIVHDYFGIDFSIIWKIKEEYLRGLMVSLSKVFS